MARPGEEECPSLITGSAIEERIGSAAEAPRPRRVRGVVSVILIVLASLSAAAGGVALYAREEVVNTDAFVDRAADALQQPTIQRGVGREITVQLLEPALPDAVAARPVIQAALKLAIGAPPFRA